MRAETATRDRDGARSSAREGLYFGAMLAALVVALLVHRLGATLNHDSAWYLDATSRWLNGAALYRDIIEVNPPLAFFLTAPALWLSGITGLAPVAVYAE